MYIYIYLVAGVHAYTNPEDWRIFIWSPETLDGVIIELPLHKRNTAILTIQNWKLLEWVISVPKHPNYHVDKHTSND